MCEEHSESMKSIGSAKAVPVDQAVGMVLAHDVTNPACVLDGTTIRFDRGMAR